MTVTVFSFGACKLNGERFEKKIKMKKQKSTTTVQGIVRNVYKKPPEPTKRKR